MRRLLRALLPLLLAAPLSAQTPVCSAAALTTKVGTDSVRFSGSKVTLFYRFTNPLRVTCTGGVADSSALLATRDTLTTVRAALKAATDSLAKWPSTTPAPTPAPTPTPAPVDTTKPAVGAYPNRPATYSKVVGELDMAQAIPASVGGSNERPLTGGKITGAWTIVGGDGTVTRQSDASAPGSAPNVWRVLMPAGSAGGSCDPGVENGCATGTGSSTGYGRWGLPINANTLYASLWVKWSPNFWFQQVSQKFLRLDIAGGAQALLIQASHNGVFLRASNEQLGQAYEPRIGTQPSRGVWHQVEILVTRGANGSLKAWLDGQLRLDYTGAMATLGPFSTFEVHSEMGGGSALLVADQWFAVDHVFLATTP